MKEIRINYFTHQHLSMLTSMTTRVIPGLSEKIDSGYPITSVPENPDFVSINIMNILRSDIEKFGSPVEKVIMRNACSLQGYDFIKSMLIEDKYCIKCKLAGAIHMAIQGILDILDAKDDIKVTFFGNGSSEIVNKSSTPKIIQECLYDNFEVKCSDVPVTCCGENSYIIRIKEERK